MLIGIDNILLDDNFEPVISSSILSRFSIKSNKLVLDFELIDRINKDTNKHYRTDMNRYNNNNENELIGDVFHFYMAPEIIIGEIDANSYNCLIDAYAYGVLLYIMFDRKQLCGLFYKNIMFITHNKIKKKKKQK